MVNKISKMKKSQFILTVNTNISLYQLNILQTDEEKIVIVKALRNGLIELKTNILQYVKNNDEVPVLKTFTANFEIGNNKKFMHSHSIISFDNYCQLDFKKIKSLLDKHLHMSKGCYINVKQVPDNNFYIKQYAEKDGLSIL